MGKINVLDFQIANLIAAGEVVERPASAVKELLENAVDAGATEITVEIKRGGVSFIRVSDNGCGMSREDMPVSIKRHATSKISKASDLDGIMTLGFRGEALAAIASVSRLRIISKRREDPAGTLLVSDCGRIEDIGDTGCKDGTTVIVEELFANVPARRKFLKKDSSEAAAVISIVQKIALSHPDIAIKMINNGNMEFKTSGDGKIESCIYAVMGRDFASGMLKVDSMFDRIEVYGYICSPDNVRANRNYQNFFINNRYIRSKTATAALEQAFDSYLEAGRFPCCVLYINIHPALVDVNVHPTKLEVKFSNEKTVFEAVYCAVRNAILSSVDRPEVIFEKDEMTPEDHSLYNAFVPVYDRIADAEEKKVSAQQMFDMPMMSDVAEENDNNDPLLTQTNIPSNHGNEALRQENNGLENTSAAGDMFGDFSEFDENLPPSDGAANETKEESTAADKQYLFSLGDGVKKGSLPPYKILGEAFNTYVTVECEGIVLIIDKHAAHERILFEQMKRIMNAQGSSSQMLIVPIRVELSAEEYETALEYREQIESLGYGMEFEGDQRCVMLSQLPSILKSEEALDMLLTILGALSEGAGSIESTRTHFFEKALYQASCKAATKAGWIDNEGTIRWIVESVLGNPDIRYCPHGRPVAVELSKGSIEKMFKRT